MVMEKNTVRITFFKKESLHLLNKTPKDCSSCMGDF